MTMPRWPERFDPDKQGVNRRTLAEVQEGTPVVVRDASGEFLRRVARTGVIRGGSFLVVWVARPEEVETAAREGRAPDAVPWPAEDVWIPGDEPRAAGGPDA
jgi:hypothetical protein